MKIVTVVGARPQFIKAAVVSRELRKKHREILVHTGQHYDYHMSDIFFRELEIPAPEYNLGIAGGTHGEMTGRMLIEIEKVLMKENPDAVLLYGDTNSTLAGALASSKLNIPVCHVEAGARLGTLTNPEEINRITTDHVSSLLLCCTESALSFLKKEGLTQGVYLVGDPMYDAFEHYRKKVMGSPQEILVDSHGTPLPLPEHFYYLTCHRQENTGSDEPLKEILTAANALDAPCIYPVHPRNKERAERLKKTYGLSNVVMCRPVGYLMSVYLTLHAKKIMTDSGGLQREAFFAHKQCVTIFDYVVWPETMVNNRNQLSKPESHEILRKLDEVQKVDEMYEPFGDGHAGEKIAQRLLELETGDD